MGILWLTNSSELFAMETYRDFSNALLVIGLMWRAVYFMLNLFSCFWIYSGSRLLVSELLTKHRMFVKWSKIHALDYFETKHAEAWETICSWQHCSNNYNDFNSNWEMSNSKDCPILKCFLVIASFFSSELSVKYRVYTVPYIVRFSPELPKL